MCESVVSVATQCDMAADAVVGPVPSSLGTLDPLVLIGLRCVDIRPRGHPLKIDLRKLESTEASFYCEWLLHVQSARDQQEQNLEVVAHEGRLYFRTTRDIKADEELLVWYGNEVARALGIPVPSTFAFKGDGKFTCPFCGEAFLFPFPCCAHVIYRCDQRRHLTPNSNDVARPLSDLPSIVPYTSPQKTVASAFSVDFLSCSSNQSSNKQIKEKTNVIRSEEENNCKRKSGETEETPAKRRESSLKGRSTEDKRLSSDVNDNSRVIENLSPSVEQNTKTLSIRLESGSAFKKVHKRPPSEETTVLTSSASHFCGINYSSAEMLYTQKSSLKSLYSMSLPVVPMSPPALLSSSSLPSAFVPTSKLLDTNDPFITDPKMAVGMIDNAARRPPLYADAAPYRLPMGCVSFPPKQFSNPLEKFPVPPVTSILPPSLTALSFPAQNWCAKCNASFRMTSDLVYHMRSHHKREIDPAKKRRDEKLKCSICHESFRERHHLTRHMTSHQ